MAKEVIINVKTKGTKAAVKDIDNLNDSIGETNDELKEVESNADAIGDSLGKAGKDGQKGLGLLGKGFKGVGGAIKGMGIGVLIGLFVILKETLERQQPVLDLIDTTFNAIGIAVSTVSDTFKTIFDRVTETTENFDALGKVFSSVGTIIKNLVMLAFTPLRLMLLALQTDFAVLKVAYESAFGDEKSLQLAKDNLAGMKDEAIKLKDSLVESGKAILDAGKTIAENAVEAMEETKNIAKVVEEEFDKIDTKKILRDAEETTRLKNMAILKKAENELALITAARDAEIQREIRDDVTKTFEERKLASEKLKVIIDEQEKLTMANAKLVVDAAEAELTTNRSSIELQEKLILAKKELIDAEETAIGFRTEQREQLRALNQEEIDSINNIIDRQTESALKFEESELKKVQIVVDANKMKVQSYIDAGDEESEAYNQAVQDLEAAEDDKLVAIEKANKEAIKIVQELQQDSMAKQIQAIKDNEALKLKILKDSKKLSAEELADLEEQLAKDTQKKIDKVVKDANKERIQATLDAVASAVNKAGQLANAITDIFQQIQDQQTQAMEEQIAERNELITEDFDNQRINLEESHINAIGSLEAKAARELAITGAVSIATQNQIIDENNNKLKADFTLAQAEFEIQKKAEKDANDLREEAFNKQKTLSLAQAAISTALAVVNALATTPYPLGVGLAIAAGVAGGIQIAAISSTQFSPESTSLSAPTMPKLAANIQPADQTNSLGLSGAGSTGALSADAQFNKQELFGVGSESVGGGAGSRQGSLKVSVLESDITSTQATVSTIESGAEFGG